MLWFHKKVPGRLPFVTDMHSHLVPGIDDGSPSVDLSVGMLDAMADWGIERLIPTPHVTEDTFENTPATIDPAWRELSDAAAAAASRVQILPPSGEYRIDSFFMNQIEAGGVRPLSGDYLLIENGYHQEPWEFDTVVFNLRNKGYIPVLAHPERYLYYHSDLDRYRRLAGGDLLLQCNLLSFAGYYGKEVRRVARWLADNGMVSFIGSDLHGDRHVKAITDYLTTADFRNTMSKITPSLLNDKL